MELGTLALALIVATAVVLRLSIGRARLEVQQQLRSLFQHHRLKSCAEASAFFGAGEAEKKKVIVRPQMAVSPDGQGTQIYYKEYAYPKPGWRFLFRSSKARCEYINYAAFEQMGIRCADRLACGEQRDWLGRLRRAFIITKAVPETLTLVEFVAKHCSDRSEASLRLRQKLLHEVAALTRRLHDNSFYHRDLFWRNILVSWQPPEDPVLWCIDCPRGGFDRWSPRRKRRPLEDLGSLDHGAVLHCTRRERLQFVKAYLGKSRLDKEAKDLVRRILVYTRRRWPEDHAV